MSPIISFSPLDSPFYGFARLLFLEARIISRNASGMKRALIGRFGLMIHHVADKSYSFVVAALDIVEAVYDLPLRYRASMRTARSAFIEAAIRYQLPSATAAACRRFMGTFSYQTGERPTNGGQEAPAMTDHHRDRRRESSRAQGFTGRSAVNRARLSGQCLKGSRAVSNRN